MCVCVTHFLPGNRWSPAYILSQAHTNAWLYTYRKTNTGSPAWSLHCTPTHSWVSADRYSTQNTGWCKHTQTHSERAWLEVPGVVFWLILQLAEAAPSAAAAALIPLKPHEGELASLLNRGFSAAPPLGPTNLEKERGEEKDRKRDPPPCSSAATPQPLCADSMESNVEDVAGCISDAVYVTVGKPSVEYWTENSGGQGQNKAIHSPLLSFFCLSGWALLCRTCSNSLMSS